MNSKQKKYKIDEEMNKLNLTMYKKALRYIPKLLNVAFNTFHNYRHMTIDAKADIPCEMVRKLEVVFGLKIGGLANYKVSCKSLKEIMRAEHNMEENNNVWQDDV